MNPDQLWETTMNPETRTIIQIQVDDPVVSDEIFTILMGKRLSRGRNLFKSMPDWSIISIYDYLR